MSVRTVPYRNIDRHSSVHPSDYRFTSLLGFSLSYLMTHTVTMPVPVIVREKSLERRNLLDKDASRECNNTCMLFSTNKQLSQAAFDADYRQQGRKVIGQH